jgi:hypothetical protein
VEQYYQEDGHFSMPPIPQATRAGAGRPNPRSSQAHGGASSLSRLGGTRRRVAGNDDVGKGRCNSQILRETRFFGMLLILAILLLLFWGGGFALHIGGGLIHLLLVIALIVFILNFARGRA